MTVRATLVSGDAAPLPDVSAIPAFVFPAMNATTGGVYKIFPGDDAFSTLGSSQGTEDVYWFLRNAEQPCVVGIAAPTAGALSGVTHTGSGPAVTAALSGSLAGPLVDATIKFKVNPGGVNGTAVLGYYLDGSGDFSQYSAQVPTEGAAVLRGKIDLSGITLSTLNSKHLDFTAPSSATITWSTPATVQDIADRFNTSASSAATTLACHSANCLDTLVMLNSS